MINIIFFFKRFLELARAVLPLMLFYVFVCCLVCVYYESDISTASLVIFGGSAIFFAAAAAGAFGDMLKLRAHTPDTEIIGGHFGGFSKKARLFSSGFSSLKANRPDDALEDFKEIENMELSDGEKAVLSFYTGGCYRMMGYPTNAANYYLKAVEYGLDSDLAYVLAARCCVSNGCFSQAMELYDKLLERNPMFEYIYTDMGMCCLKSGDPDKALECFEHSVSEGKNYSFALGGCSLAYLMKKDIDKSREYFSKALVNNLSDINGFRKYYCSVAEAAGCLDLIDEHMKKAAEEVPLPDDEENNF
ncbi:MAG: tetratricopeptide repeat protein [Oscillospiraceae bacterium]